MKMLFDLRANLHAANLHRNSVIYPISYRIWHKKGQTLMSTVFFQDEVMKIWQRVNSEHLDCLFDDTCRILHRGSYIENGHSLSLGHRINTIKG